MLVYEDHNCTFKTLFKKDHTFPIHRQTLNCLLVEIFKVIHGLTRLF